MLNRVNRRVNAINPAALICSSSSSSETATLMKAHEDHIDAFDIIGLRQISKGPST